MRRKGGAEAIAPYTSLLTIYRFEGTIMTVDPTITNLVVFVLAVFVGYHVIWNVTPALHTPLMSLTNAISSVIIVGAILAAGASALDLGSTMGVIAVGLASVNVAGGFLVTQRMLEMFKKKEPKGEQK